MQVKDPGEQWDEFPVTATTRNGGRYLTQIYTSRTGERAALSACAGSMDPITGLASGEYLRRRVHDTNSTADREEYWGWRMRPVSSSPRPPP